MRRLWQRIREAFEDNMRQQVTWAGFVFTLTVVLVGLAAFASGNNLLFLLLAALLSTLLISGFVSRLGLAGLELDLILPPHIAAGRAVSGRLVVKNRKWLMPSFSLHLTGSSGTGFRHELYIPLIPAGGYLNEPVELLFSKRGVYKENTLSFSSRFPFGFTHRRAHVRLEREVLVYPCIDVQPGLEAVMSELAGEFESKLQGRGHDFYRLRPYEALESARHVDWRATAHTGELQIREFARERDPLLAVFLDLNASISEAESFEKFVNCAAFLMWRMHERNARVRFLTQRFDAVVPREASVFDVLRYLATVEPDCSVRTVLPYDTDAQIAFSSDRERIRNSGWPSAHVVTPEQLGSALTLS